MLGADQRMDFIHKPSTQRRQGGRGQNVKQNCPFSQAYLMKTVNKPSVPQNKRKVDLTKMASLPSRPVDCSQRNEGRTHAGSEIKEKS